MIKIEICWNDLTYQKQTELLEKLGDDIGCSVMPLTILEFEEEEE